MKDNTYSDRELDSEFSNLLDHMRVFENKVDGHFIDLKEGDVRIETQTTRTNGRVTKLERWQSYVIGFCAAITALILPLIYIVIEKVIQ